VFDVNRGETIQGLLAPTPIEYLERIRNATDMPFRITLIASRASDTEEVASYSRAPRSSDTLMEPLSLAWPKGVFSLSHVAVPFPPDDPVYGLTPAEDALPRFPLGAVSARGESGALVVPSGLLARLRSNPFFDVIRSKVVMTCQADEGGLERTSSH
jgi:hypothetical protein